MVSIAQQVPHATGLPSTESWYISKPEDANALIRQDQLDLVTQGRSLLADPHWPYRAAKELGVVNAAWATLPPPYAHWLARYR